jgi:hypothetical protein
MNKIKNYLQNRIEKKKHYHLWKRILDILNQKPQPLVKIIFKNCKWRPAIGPIIGVQFGQPGRGHYDFICIIDSETLSPRFLALSDILKVEEVEDE